MAESTQAPPVLGSIVWTELFTTDVDAAKKFFTSLLEWKTGEMDMGPEGMYTVFKTGEKTVAGIMTLPPEAKKAGAPAHWMSYISVKDLDATTGKVAGLGGCVVVPPTPIPNVGRFSIIKDPTGAVVGLFQDGAESA